MQIARDGYTGPRSRSAGKVCGSFPLQASGYGGQPAGRFAAGFNHLLHGKPGAGAQIEGAGHFFFQFVEVAKGRKPML